MPTAEEYKNMSDSEKKKEDWMNSKWRPMMGWLYMATCTFDFVIFPILWSLLQSIKGIQVTQWNPLTLQGAGLYHIAMGAVLGLAAFGRTQEKLAGANNGGIQASAPSMPAAPSMPSSGGFGAPSSFGSPQPTSFGAPAQPSFSGGGFGSPPQPTQGFQPQVVSGFGGKPAPVQPPDPQI